MRILIATDGSEGARNSARALTTFPLPAGSRALVLSAAPQISHHAKSTETAVHLQRRMHELATEAVTQAADTIRSRLAAVETSIASGDPRHAILDAAQRWKADLIVLGARGLGGVARILLGSVSDAVTRHATCPVLVVKTDAPCGRHIIIGIDGSQPALAAARFIAGLPLTAGTTVRLVAAVEPPPFVAVPGGELDSGLGREMVALDESLRAGLDAAVKDSKALFAGVTGVTVETSVTHGYPAHVLVGECGARKSDLLVVGARGVGVFERILLGSVSSAVLHHAPCSVLVVRGS